MGGKIRLSYIFYLKMESFVKMENKYGKKDTKRKPVKSDTGLNFYAFSIKLIA